jgi:membrane fusion protein, multidrug efflux system
VYVLSIGRVLKRTAEIWNDTLVNRNSTESRLHQIRTPGSVAAALVFILVGCTKVAPPQVERGAVPVAVAKAARKSVPVLLNAIGNVEAYSTIAVKAQIGGYLRHVYFKEGQDVQKDALLFEIDPRPYEQAVSQAEATIVRDIALQHQAEANLAKDKAQSENTRAQANRYSKLTTEGVVSKEQNEQFRTNANAMDESVKADQAAIESALAAVNADRAALEAAKLNLSYCRITSPINGRTGILQVKEGNLVKANADTPMVTINQVAPIYVTFAVPEQQLGAVRESRARSEMRVEAQIPNRQAAAKQGVLTLIDNAVDITTGTIKRKASFPNTENLLWPGQFVNVVMTLGHEANVTVVPSEAVQTGQSGPYAFVVKSDNTVESRQLITGRVIGHETIVDKGIQPGDTVVIDGQMRLVPGALVKPTATVAQDGVEPSTP